ncbi:MAG: glycosyltransferase [Opitutaceae bacterium]|nr:glycosyltransferase [Opitutaceae bacterium]
MRPSVDREVTVVIPTYGTGTCLNSVLRGLAAQDHRDFEVIVVDNNPRQQWNPSLPGRHLSTSVVHEPRNGLQHARNAGVENARGLYVAFLDDDGVPLPTWLTRLVEGTRRYGAMAAGGSISLEFESDPPSWFGVHERALLSELTHPCDVPAIADHMYIVGANMCIARRAFEKVGLFDARFDRTATSLRSSGELEFTRRLQSADERVSFIASAWVRHQIPGARLTKRYLLSRAYWQGRSDALLHSAWGRPAAFGHRDWRSNIKALYSRLRALLASSSYDDTIVRGFSLARELGYCFQTAILYGRPLGHPLR